METNILYLTLMKQQKGNAMQTVKIVLEKLIDGFVAYPLGIPGIIVGEGDTYEEALNNVKSAIQFHIASFGRDSFALDSPILDAFIAEANLLV